MKTIAQTPPISGGTMGQPNQIRSDSPIPLVWDRQDKTALRRDLSIVRERLAVMQGDPSRAKLACLLDHLRRQIERELR